MQGLALAGSWTSVLRWGHGPGRWARKHVGPQRAECALSDAEGGLGPGSKATCPAWTPEGPMGNNSHIHLFHARDKRPARRPERSLPDPGRVTPASPLSRSEGGLGSAVSCLEWLLRALCSHANPLKAFLRVPRTVAPSSAPSLGHACRVPLALTGPPRQVPGLRARGIVGDGAAQRPQLNEQAASQMGGG